MTTHSWVATPYQTSDAAFRAWGSSVNTALAAIGLVNTSDTGQINWTTVTTPSGSSVYQGYEIWRFDDTLQGSFPIFFKLEYGAAPNGGGAYAGLRITLGKGSNGSGTITGILESALVMANAAANSAANSYASSSGTGMAMYLAPGQCNCSFAIERSLDSSGNGTGDGLMLVFSGNSASYLPCWRMYSYANGATTNVWSYSPIQLPGAITNGTAVSSSFSVSKDGSTGVVFPIPICCPGVPPWISKQLIAVGPGDATSTFTAAPHGTSLTYRAVSILTVGSSLQTCPVELRNASNNFSVPAAIYWQ